MALEIEHKYLVKNDSYKESAISSFSIRQGYLCREPERTVRVRIKDDKAFLTIKGKNSGAMRLEFEYEIPYEEGVQLLSLCSGRILEKTRYHYIHEGHLWEIDEFFGCNYGLVTAEIELKYADEKYSLPDFIGENVTGNPDYYNSNL